MTPTEFTEDQLSGFRKLIESCLEDIKELPNSRERAINIKTIYYMTHTNYHKKDIIKEIMCEFDYIFRSRETLENLLCPSPGLLKSLAVTGESESYVDPI